MYLNTIFAGFGGQGVLMVGNVLVHAAMYDNKKVTWMPSYGVEMRGGTANCTVVVSDDEIGSPVIGHPLSVVAFNLPSKEKFEPLLKTDGLMIVNSSLIEDKVKRDDINVLYIPLNKMADELGEPRAMNMIALGALLEVTQAVSLDTAKKAIEDSFAKKPMVIEINKKALGIGAQFAREHGVQKAKQLTA
jgi:2-oxoglutarate ferredoxin oxidoreductase subunit gamma